VLEADATGPEIKRTMDLNALLAEAVAETISGGGFPLTLSGNCITCLGTTGGISRPDLGVVWFDAHADFDTPDDNLSGFFDVFALAILTGTGWRALRRTIPGFLEIPERRVVLVGVRDLASYQADRLKRSSLNIVWGEDLAGRIESVFGEALESLEGCDSIYLQPIPSAL
jgi:arginase